MDAIFGPIDQLFTGFERLAANPSANIAALATAIAIIVLAVLIVVLLLLALALPSMGRKRKRRRKKSQKPGEQRPQQTVITQAKRRPKPAADARATAAAFAVFLVGLIGTFAAAYQMTSTTTYCTATCHSMDEASNTWEQSAHTNVACVRCHEGPPWVSAPSAIVLRLHDLSREFGYNDFRDLRVLNRNCIDCHSRVLDVSLEARNGEPFTHRQVLDASTRCNDCHGAQGHVPNKTQ
jgi:cytochrome c-type protein NapC